MDERKGRKTYCRNESQERATEEKGVSTAASDPRTSQKFEFGHGGPESNSIDSI